METDLYVIMTFLDVKLKYNKSHQNKMWILSCVYTYECENKYNIFKMHSQRSSELSITKLQPEIKRNYNGVAVGVITE